MDAIQLQPAGTPSSKPADSARMEKAAREFEAQLLAELLRHVQTKTSLDGTEESSADEQYQSMSTQAVAEGMAAGGGFGIAKGILNQVNRGNK